jgi:capsular exopolysaccharide synthesis family protein
LIGDTDINGAILDTDTPNLRILPSGQVPPNPSELLSSVEFGKMLSELRGSADLVILDASPILPVTDALEMATKADGVMLVSDPAVSTRAMVEQAREQLERVGANLVGGIMNNLRPTRYSYYPYYAYYGGTYNQGGSKDAKKSGWSGFLSRLRPSKGKT